MLIELLSLADMLAGNIADKLAGKIADMLGKTADILGKTADKQKKITAKAVLSAPDGYFFFFSKK